MVWADKVSESLGNYGSLMAAVERFFTDRVSAYHGLEGSLLTGTTPTFGPKHPGETYGIYQDIIVRCDVLHFSVKDA